MMMYAISSLSYGFPMFSPRFPHGFPVAFSGLSPRLTLQLQDLGTEGGINRCLWPKWDMEKSEKAEV